MINTLHKLCVICILTFFAIGCEEQQKLPNIVFYITDDQSQLDCSVYGNEMVRTPNTELLAKAGITFESAYVASPACAPSRAALLTGLMPSRNGAEENHSYPKPGTQILIKNLQQKGYEVLSFGKIAHNKYGEKIGFDYYDEDPTNLAKHVSEFFETHKTDKPICLLVGDRRPHVPWTPDKIYDPSTVKLPQYLLDTKETREHWAEYYSDITGADAEMGEIYELAKSKFGDNFIFVFSADHGGQWPFGKWNLYDAGIKVPLVMVWPGHIQPNTRTNTMVSWVDIFPTLLDMVGAQTPPNLDGQSFKDVVLDRKENHREYIFTTHSGDRHFNVFPMRSVTDGKYKYIKNLYPQYYHSNHSDILRKEHAGAYWNSWDDLAKTDSAAAATVKKYYVREAEEFFDLTNDSNEQQNLINEPEYADQVVKMKQLLQTWMKEQNDSGELFSEPYPITEKYPYHYEKFKKRRAKDSLKLLKKS